MKTHNILEHGSKPTTAQLLQFYHKARLLTPGTKPNETTKRFHSKVKIFFINLLLMCCSRCLWNQFYQLQFYGN